MRVRLQGREEDGQIVGLLVIPDELFTQLGWSVFDWVSVKVRGGEVVIQKVADPSVAPEKE